MSIKKEKVLSNSYSYLIYKIFFLRNYRWLEKLNPFHEREDEYELVVKHLENLLIENIC